MAKVCLVTGASRGIGRGIALALCEAGHTVYITGRTLTADNAGIKGQQFGGLQQTVDDAQARGGGKCIPVVLDHADDDAVSALFDRIDREQGHLHLLCNNCFAGAVDGMEHGMLATGKGFWDKPMNLWDLNANIGLRSHYVASVMAAKRMVSQKSGLIINISSPGGLKWFNDVAYGVAKAGVDRLATDMAKEFKLLKTGVSALCLWPGAVGTEIVKSTGFFPADKLESVEYTGRCVRALLDDDGVGRHSGKTLNVGEVALEYGVFDVDGKQPLNAAQAAEMDLLIGGNRGKVYRASKM